MTEQTWGKRAEVMLYCDSNQRALFLELTPPDGDYVVMSREMLLHLVEAKAQAIGCTLVVAP